MKTIFSFLLTIITIQPISLYCQQSDTSRLINLKELVYSVNKEAELKRDIAQDVYTIPNKEIQLLQTPSAADLLFQAGISVQKSQQGGGSPILRGFEASRILLIVDGVRMNNLIYRAGHLQDIIKTDQNLLEKVEVLYGPSSNLYGSDALGGAIYLFTKNPQFAIDKNFLLKLNASTNFESASNGTNHHLDFNLASKSFASLSSISYKNFGDLVGGKNSNPFYSKEYGTRKIYTQSLGNGKDTILNNDNKYKQISSGYSQIDLIQKFSYRPKENLLHQLNLQYSNSSDIPRYDRLTDPSGSTKLRSSEWYYGPQTRLMMAYQLEYHEMTKMFDHLNTSVHYQNLTESRHNRNFNNATRNSRIEKVSVAGLNLDLVKNVSSHTIRYGVEIQLNSLNSTASRENIATKAVSKLDTRYPDGDNIMNNFAGYVSHSWKIGTGLALVDGFRVGYSQLSSSLVDTALQFHLPYTSLEQKTPVYSGSIGLISTPSDDLKWSILLSTGYRVPNVDDLSKVFGSAPGKVIVPNPDIKPEQTINYEMGFSKLFSNKTQWENSIYFTDFKNIGIIDNFTLNGQDSILYDGVKSKVLANQNKNKAYIYGFSSSLKSNLDEHFSVGLRMNYTYGRIRTDSSDAPLDHIPPLNIHGSLSWNIPHFISELYIHYNGWKKIKDYYLNGEDNEQYATSEGMPAWLTVNWRAALQATKYLSIQVGVDNIFDTQYRTFASGINAPGRNFILGLRGRF